MLILARRVNESIIIDGKTTITILSIKGKQVRVGIDAPDHIPVHRQEIYDQIKEKQSDENESTLVLFPPSD